MLSGFILMFLINSKPLKDIEFFRQDLSQLQNFSLFSKFVMIVGATILQFCAYCVFPVQILNRRKVADFMNAALKMKLNDKYFAKFKKACVKSTSLLMIYFSSAVIFKFFTIMVPSILNFFVYLFLSYPFIIMFALVSFVKMFENFIVTYLQEIESDIIALSTSKLHYIDAKSEDKDFLLIRRKYQNLFEFVEKFKISFGAHLTISVSFITTAIVFSVNR